MQQYSLMELFDKYHSTNKYSMLKYMNYNKSKNENNSENKLYSMDGIWQVDYSIIQNGGDIYDFEHSGKKYIFDVYKRKEDDLRRVFIRSFLSKSNQIDSENCAQLVYKSDSEKVKIESLNGLRGCVKLKSKESKTIDKQGTLLMFGIIQWAKDKKFKKIVLEDESFIECVDSKIVLKYQLSQGYILQTGYPWYWKFGFRYKNENMNKDIEKAKKYLDKLKTSDLSFESLVDMLISILRFNNYIEYDMLDNKKILNQIGQMSEIYLQEKDKPAYNFFVQMYYSCCDIMSCITKELFESFKLFKNKSTSNEMVLEL